MDKKEKRPLKIRCSQLGKVMTNGRGKGAGMGDTAKGYIRELYIKNNYGREQIINTKEMRKGIECEEDAITLASKVSNRLMLKNTNRFKNDYLVGTPDVIMESDNLVIDLKTSWDIWTFAKAELTKLYEFQLRGYMMLTGAENAELTFALVSTPDLMISDALYRMHFIYPGGDENPQYEKDAKQVEKNMTFDDINPKERIKTFYIKRDKSIENAIIERVEEAREFYNTIKL